MARRAPQRRRPFGRGWAVRPFGATVIPASTMTSGSNAIIDPATSVTPWSLPSGTKSTITMADMDGRSRTVCRFVRGLSGSTLFVEWVPGGTFAPPSWAGGIEADIYVTDYAYGVTDGVPFSMQLRNDAGSQIIQAIACRLPHGWNRVRIPKSMITTFAGSATWNTTGVFTRIQFRFGGIGGLDHDVRFGGMRWVDGENLGNRAKICVMFDDIGASVYTTAFPIMRDRGIVGTNAVISDAIGSPSFGGYARCSAAQLLEMNRAGWDCVNHTKSHESNLHLSSVSAIQAEIEACRDAIIASNLGNGISEHLFCAPFGEYSANYYAAAQNAGVRMFRLGVMANSSELIYPIGTRFGDLYRVPCIVIINTWPTASLINIIDSVIANGGNLILLFHHIMTPADASIKYTPANFTTVMDALAARRGQFDSVNLTDLYRYSVGRV